MASNLSSPGEGFTSSGALPDKELSREPTYKPDHGRDYGRDCARAIVQTVAPRPVSLSLQRRAATTADAAGGAPYTGPCNSAA